MSALEWRRDDGGRAAAGRDGTRAVYGYWTPGPEQSSPAG